MSNIPSLSGLPLKDVASALLSDQQKATPPWRVLGLFLDGVERDATWQSEAQSFTAYVEELAGRLERSPNLLWRSYGAVRTWSALRPMVGKARPGLDTPESVIDLPTNITPETIELLEKISRAARPEVWREIVEGVFEKRLTRTHLRANWAAMRGKLGGRTKRGRGTFIPQYSYVGDKPEQSDIELAILAQAPECLGFVKPSWFAIYREVQLPAGPMLPLALMTFVIAVQNERTGPVDLHGVIAEPSVHEEYLHQYTSYMASFVDVLWYAAIADTDTEELLLDAKIAGLLRFEDGKLSIGAVANPTDDCGQEVGTLAKLLLLKKSTA